MNFKYIFKMGPSKFIHNEWVIMVSRDGISWSFVPFCNGRGIVWHNGLGEYQFVDYSEKIWKDLTK